MHRQHRFDVDWIDVQAARNDHVLLAVQNVQIAVTVKPANIAATQVHTRTFVGLHRLGRFLRLLVIPTHKDGGISDNLANFASWKLSSIVSAASMEFGINTAILSPLEMPRSSSVLATRFVRALNSRHVSRRFPHTTAVLCVCQRALPTMASVTSTCGVAKPVLPSAAIG